MELLLSTAGEHWFWGILTLACLLWYSTITIYVAVKGAGDIRKMLRILSERRGRNP